MNALSIIKKSGVVQITVAVAASMLLVVMTVNASTTISTDISTGGALSVTGASTLTGAVSAASTLAVTGAIAASSTLQVTDAITTYGTVTNKGAVSDTSTFTQGSAGTAITAIQFGSCTLTTATANATSSVYTICTGAGTVDNNYKVFLQPTSTLLPGLTIGAASTTVTAGTISVRIDNPFGNSGGGVSTSTGAGTVSFWAVR